MTCQQKQMQSAAIAETSTPRVRDWQAMPSAVEKPPMVGMMQFKVHEGQSNHYQIAASTAPGHRYNALQLSGMAALSAHCRQSAAEETNKQEHNNGLQPVHRVLPDVSLSRRLMRLTTATACNASSRVGLPPLRTLPGRLNQACN